MDGKNYPFASGDGCSIIINSRILMMLEYKRHLNENQRTNPDDFIQNIRF